MEEMETFFPANGGQVCEDSPHSAGVYRTPWGCLLWTKGTYDPELYPFVDGELADAVRGQRKVGAGNKGRWYPHT